MTDRTFKVMSFPRAIYDRVKEERAGNSTTNREILRKAVERFLPVVERLCRKARFAPADDRVWVRAAINVETIEQLNAAAERLGLDATTLTFLCLRNYFDIRQPTGKKSTSAKVSTKTPAKQRGTRGKKSADRD